MAPEEDQLSAELLEILGEDVFIRLVEHHAGCRLFVPIKVATTRRFERSGIEIQRFHDLAREVGLEAAQLLSARYGGDYIRVPLARTARAKRYRLEGLSLAKIAVRLGVGETGVDKLFRRLRGWRDNKPRFLPTNSNTRPSDNDDKPSLIKPRRLIRAAGDR